MRDGARAARPSWRPTPQSLRAAGTRPEALALTKQRAPTPNLVNPRAWGRAPQRPAVQLLADGQHSLVPQPCRERRELG